jgi:hypothetical protein
MGRPFAGPLTSSPVEGIMSEPSGYAIIVGVTGSDDFEDAQKSETCEQDAKDMAKFAKGKGFQLLGPGTNGPQQDGPFLTASATKNAIQQVMAQAADKLKPEDILFVYFSGHGGTQAITETTDAQYVCLKDDNLWDYEWNKLLSDFPKDTRVLSVVDSCYGGGFGPSTKNLALPFGFQLCQSHRADPRPKQIVWDGDADAFETLRAALGRTPISAQYLQLSACQGNQLACVGKTNGRFTKALLDVAEKQPDLNYRNLYRTVLKRFDATQSPDYYSRGTAGDDFGKETAFSIHAAVKAQPLVGHALHHITK